MIDLLSLWAFLLILIFFSLRKRIATLATGLIFLLVSFLLFLFHPVFFSHEIDGLCESNLNDIPAGSKLLEPQAKTYQNWRGLLELGGNFTFSSATGTKSLLISPPATPWWFPEVEGTELEMSKGLAFRCSPPVAIDRGFNQNFVLWPMRRIRIASLAGSIIDSKEQARTIMRSLQPKEIVKINLLYDQTRAIVPFGRFDGSEAPLISFYNMEMEGQIIFDKRWNNLFLLPKFNCRNIYSSLGFLDKPSGENCPVPQLGALGAGFNLGPRIFYFSPVKAFAGTMASLYRMSGIHGQGTLQNGWSFFSSLPKAWYLLPLPRFWTWEFHLYKLSCLLAALGALLIAYQAIKKLGLRIPEMVLLPLIYLGTLLMLLNDLWVVIPIH